MKFLTFAALGGCALLLACAPVQAADPDLEKLQGKWIVESFEYNGNSVDMMKEATREFKAEKYTLKPKSGDAIDGTVTLDSTKTPKTIDLDVNGQKLQGIYELDGDTLKLCYRLNDGERPTEFASKPDSGAILVVHKRAK